MRSLGFGSLALLSLAGCAAAERPSLQSLVEREQWVEACKNIDQVGTTASDVRARRDATRRVGVAYRTTIELAPEALDSANARLGFDLLHGGLASLRVSAVSRGPSVYSTRIVVAVREDGTLWRSLGTHKADHDLLARLFGRERPPSTDASSSTPAAGPQVPPEVGQQQFDPHAAAKRFQTAVERCPPDANPCEQWFPLARVAPSLGPEEVTIDLDLWLEGPKGRCLLETRRHVPLPAGATLHEKLVALAARGPLEVWWGSSDERPAPPAPALSR